jgi:hypothetical protein
MAKKPNFESILDKPASQIDRPKPIPMGTYVTLIKGQPRHDNAKTGTEFYEFTHQILEAGKDVDEDDLTAALTKASGEVTPLRDKSLRQTFYITEDSLYRLQEFGEHCGVDLEDVGSVRAMIAELPGKTVGVKVTHKPSDSGVIYANITSTFKVEE